MVVERTIQSTVSDHFKQIDEIPLDKSKHSDTSDRTDPPCHSDAGHFKDVSQASMVCCESEDTQHLDAEDEASKPCLSRQSVRSSDSKLLERPGSELDYDDSFENDSSSEWSTTASQTGILENVEGRVSTVSVASQHGEEDKEGNSMSALGMTVYILFILVILSHG